MKKLRVVEAERIIILHFFMYQTIWTGNKDELFSGRNLSSNALKTIGECLMVNIIAI